MARFSDYIIYADESGSPVLSADEIDFPVFVLVFMMVEKSYFAEALVPQLLKLKFEFVGHDQIILHERDIRRQSGAFSFLQVSAAVREEFIGRLTGILKDAEMALVYALIDKKALKTKYADPWDPYDLALTFCVEGAADWLAARREGDTDVSFIFEARGKTEDAHLELQFRRIAAGLPRVGTGLPVVKKFKWIPRFVDKRANSTGLQIADLVARPIGRKYLRPKQANRAFETIQSKIRNSKEFP